MIFYIIIGIIVSLLPISISFQSNQLVQAQSAEDQLQKMRPRIRNWLRAFLFLTFDYSI
jgi:Trk-type K+ transport system membrane component